MTGAVLDRKPPQEKTATGLKNKKWVNPIYSTSGEHQEDGEGKAAKKALVVAPQAKRQLTMAERRKLAGKQGAQAATIHEVDESQPVSCCSQLLLSLASCLPHDSGNGSVIMGCK